MPFLIALVATVAIEALIVELVGFRRLWRQIILEKIVTHPLL